MFLNRLIAATGLFAAVLFLTVPGTRATEKCESFRLVTDPDGRLVKLIDLGETGPSHGDIRIGYTAVHDETGSEVGYVRWSVQALGQQENLGNSIIILENGQLHLQYLFQPVRPHDDEVSTVLRHGIEGIVLGGTGIFENAGGNFVLSVSGDSATYDLRLHCD